MNKFRLWCILYTSFGAFFYGYDSGLTTSIIGYPEFISYFGFNATSLGALGSVYYAGNFIGASINVWLPDKFGRLRGIQVASVVSLIGCAMQTGAQSLPVLLVGRAIGGVWSLCPMFASEMSPPNLRGRVGGLYTVNINASYALVEWMGLGFSYLSGSQLKWRIFLALQILCAIIMLVGSIWMPESPRWLIANNRDQEAFSILKRLHAVKGPANSTISEENAIQGEVPLYKREFHQIEAQIRLEKETARFGVVKILKTPSYRKRLYIIVFFFFFQQATAIIPLQNYQVILYKALGLSGKMPLILVGVWGTTALLVGIVGAYFFDRLGRRKSFFISISGILLGSAMLAAFWARYEVSNNTNKVMGNLALLSMFVFLAGYGWIMNSFGYTYTPEITPMEIRATGMAIGFAAKTALVVMLVQVTPIAIEAISWRYFVIFIVMDIIFVVGFWLYFPETANIPLEEVAAVFGDEVVVKLDDSIEAFKHVQVEQVGELQERDRKHADSRDIQHIEVHG
ncbi:hypothetical protein OHC33_002977 [Knufia fluminis]|uniref:Major facilitator superfamily (MFS) profile domain-containing protein n=1 Tax=Knufia fluminis TaxID=191047 RepID=A0AAN8EUR3_9EURO|nr:hypothetical protein OHC33_002977 [Knufia fluminis]